MDWLNQETIYSKNDLGKFECVPGGEFHIVAVTYTATDDTVDVASQSITKDGEYEEWIEKSKSLLEAQTVHRPTQPTHLLVIHERYRDEAHRLPYSEDTFRLSVRTMRQHRSLAHSVSRTSPAVFNSRHDPWDPKDQVIVYNCKSDTNALGSKDDILLSTTYFKTKPWIFSMIYGYPKGRLPSLMKNLRKFKMFAFQPLMMPMIFAEFERHRLMTRSEVYNTKLPQRDLVMHNTLKEDEEAQKKKEIQSPQKRDGNSVIHILNSFLANLKSIRNEVSHKWAHGTKTSGLQEKEEGNSSQNETGGGNAKAEERTARQALLTATRKDLESTELLRDVSHLIAGMECFRKVLVAMQGQMGTFQHSELQPQINVNAAEASRRSERIISGLRDMNAEIENTIMTFQGLLTVSERSSQVEWNYYSRRDAADSFVITRASKEDSAQMKAISLLGMIFLPGTFLATFFSMSFFKWIPDDNPATASPYLGVYFGLTIVCTLVTIGYWRWKRREGKRADEKRRKGFAGEA